MEENYNELQTKSLINVYESANKTGVICQTILNTIIALAYILEVVKGNRTLVYTLVVVALCWGPVILAWLKFKADPKTEFGLMRIIGVGFALLYGFVLFSAQNNLVFTYALPMLLICMLFNKADFVYIIGIGVIIFNIVSVIVSIATHKEYEFDMTVSYEIQVLLMIMCVIFFIMINRKFGLFNEIRMARLSLEKMKINEILERVLGLSRSMIEDVETVESKMINVNSSMEQTINSMSEVSTGTNESAEAIQNQLLKTEQIQDSIGSVEKSVEVMGEYMDKSVEAVEHGREQIDNLKRLAGDAQNAGKEVSASLEAFTEYTNKMNSITELINSVASQTSLLALNASIEAARAGEAGRGFAVVATEISNLAGQTTSATADINELINNISSQLNNMVEKIDSLISTNKIQGETAEKTAENFSAINDSIDEIKKQSVELNDSVIMLADANKEIVDSIQTISAITEEVSAHSSETFVSSEQNQVILKEVEQIVVDLSNKASKLNEE